MNAYVTKVYEGLKARNSHESEFLQAAWEILSSLSPVFRRTTAKKPTITLNVYSVP